MIKNSNYHTSSFKDNSGYVFEHNGKIYRKINFRYKENYDHFNDSGLYAHLVKKTFYFNILILNLQQIFLG